MKNTKLTITKTVRESLKNLVKVYERLIPLKEDVENRVDKDFNDSDFDFTMKYLSVFNSMTSIRMKECLEVVKSDLK